jgi:broad specificity phosphatase PhoE
MSGPPGRAVLIRHGETEWSRNGRHTGRTELALTPEGEAQVRAAASRLAGWTFAAVLVSPRQRALATAKLLGMADRAEVSADLAEWDYGEYEGRTGDEIREERPGWVLWFDGAPDGETASQVAARADRIVARARAAEGDVLIVSHGHFLRVLAARWLGEPVASGRLFRLGTATLSTMGWEHGRPAVEVWNCAG